MKKTYSFSEIENKEIYNNWNELLEKNYSKINDFSSLKTILLPPPNITGSLHLGHAYEAFIQDYIIRRNLIKGIPTYWIAGVDHAGIAVNKKIEDFLLQNKNKVLSPQEKFDFTLNQWFPKNKKILYEQWSRLGLLLDIKNINFTLENAKQKQVESAFIELYKKGFIFKDKKIINWDNVLKSAISDLETEIRVENKELFFLRYKIVEIDEYLIVATSKPETIFADVALVVNPKDERYKKFIGKHVYNLLNNEKILPIISSSEVKIDFGTGVLKCTPAHDIIDYSIAKDNNLEIISCCDEKGLLLDWTGEWAGLFISQSRNSLVKKLKSLNKCQDKTVFYLGNNKYSTRTNSIIEPILSSQWFVDLDKLYNYLKKNLKIKISDIKFVLNSFLEKLKSWANKLDHWCISRQIWWGHRIPAWYDINTGKLIAVCKKEELKNYDINQELLIQDQDVLDTWFSSSLWPIISLSKEKDEFPKVTHYPHEYLVTGSDILFFWVFKMIVMNTFFIKKLPFKKVFLHGLVLDQNGKKMSKTKGNGLDPLLLIEKYGSDSLRLFFHSQTILSKDVIFNEEKLINCWKICVKIFNLALFIKKINLSCFSV